MLYIHYSDIEMLTATSRPGIQSVLVHGKGQVSASLDEILY